MMLLGPGPLAFTLRDLPTVNALLNATATVLLLTGFYLIKQRDELLGIFDKLCKQVLYR